jgi:nucleoside-diphosphate-sugar epimerase
MGTALVAAAAASGHDVVSIDVSPAGPGPAEGEPQDKPQDKPAGRVIQLAADATSYEQLKGALRGCDAVVHLAGRPAPVPWPSMPTCTAC